MKRQTHAFDLEDERSGLLDRQLELRSGRNGINAVLRNPSPEEREAPHEPMAMRVALHPFIAGMNQHHLALLTDCALAAHFKKGAVILKEGEFADRFYLIESGKIALEAEGNGNRATIVDTIGAGDLLGWSWMFPPYVWHFTARAVMPVNAIYFYGRILREYCEKDHSLGFELFKRMSVVMLKRLQAARSRMVSIDFPTPTPAEWLA